MTARQLIVIGALIATLPAAAQSLTGRALVSYQHYDFTRRLDEGMRQSYDLGLDRAFTGTSRLRLFFRAEDFRGTTEFPVSRLVRDTRSREYQPSGELLVDTDTIRLLLRGDYIDYSASADRFLTDRTTQRGMANLLWAPVGLPSLSVVAVRNATKDQATGSEPIDDSAYATMQYPWRGFTASVESRYVRSSDPGAGYERKLASYGANIGYSMTAAGGRLSLAADAGALRSNIDERATRGEQVQVPVPVPFARAYFAVDDTPNESRDHPLSPYPTLRDGDLNTSAGIPMGPDGASFYNIAFDAGRVERVDEIRVFVRDGDGNPLRTGGGPVTWDAYVSDDGIVWRPISGSDSQFDSVRSAYVITFPLVDTRWAKVVSFGVNSETSSVTELQAFHHVTIEPGGARNGEQQTYNATISVIYSPSKRLNAAYGGTYSSLRQDYAAFAADESTSMDHMLSLDYRLASQWLLRTQGTLRESRTYTGATDTADTMLAAVDYTPTRRLQLIFETNRQTQTLLGVASTIETVALRAAGQPVRAFTLNANAGVQRQSLDGNAASGRRTFFDLAGSGRLTRTTRLQLGASIQRATSESSDPASLLLGASRDDRVFGEVIWQPGRPLLVSTRLGYVSSELLSGFTQRVRMEWSPFGAGAVSLTATYDEDIDPMADRRARRMVFSPRWALNRFVTLDVSYTAVSSTVQSLVDEQKTLFATVTVTK